MSFKKILERAAKQPQRVRKGFAAFLSRPEAPEPWSRDLPVPPLGQVSHLSASEPLEKASYKRLKEMFQNQPEADETVRWTADNIKSEPLQVWYLKHYRQDPKKYGSETHREEIKHIDGMKQVSPKLKNFDWSQHKDYESGVAEFKEAEQNFMKDEGKRYIEPDGKKVIDLGNGMGWYKLDRPACNEEGRAMGHCGNKGDPQKNDKIYSLRREVDLGGQKRHEPHLTFIDNKGWIGEMKGRGNQKPAAKYHPHIAELLKHPDVKGLVGGGYMAQNNFHINDLSPELKAQVKEKNPSMVDLRDNTVPMKERLSASKTMPKLEKYKGILKDIRHEERVHKHLNKKTSTVSGLPSEDLRHAMRHPKFGKEDLDRMVNETGEKSDAYRHSRDENAKNVMALAATPSLTSENLHSLIQKMGGDPAFIEPFLAHKQWTPEHTDALFDRNPHTADRLVGDKPWFVDRYFDKIPDALPHRARELKDDPRFTREHALKAAAANTYEAKTVVPEGGWNAAEISHLLRTSSNLERTLSDTIESPHFSTFHIDDVLNSQDPNSRFELARPATASKILKSPRITPQHFERLMRMNTSGAVEHFIKHPMFNQEHMNTLVETHGKKLAEDQGNSPLMTADVIHKLIAQPKNTYGTSPVEYAAADGRRRETTLFSSPNLNESHVEHIINTHDMGGFRGVSQVLAEHPVTQPHHIDQMIQRGASAYDLSNSPHLNSSHIDKLMDAAEPGAAAGALMPFGPGNSKVTDSHLARAVDDVTAHGSPSVAAKLLDRHGPALTEEQRHRLISQSPVDMLEQRETSKYMNAGHLDGLKNLDMYTAARAAAHPNASPDQMDHFVGRVVKMPGKQEDAHIASVLRGSPHLKAQHIADMITASPGYQNHFYMSNGYHEAMDLVKQKKLKKASILVKSDSLVKGSRQRKTPYDPSDLPMSTKQKVFDAQLTYYTPSMNQESTAKQPKREKARATVPEMSPEMRERAIGRLYKKTHSRRNSETNEVEFLLHRGMGHRETQKILDGKPGATGWTPHESVAREFATKGSKLGHVASAWVPEGKIKHALFMAGKVSSDPDTFDPKKNGKNEYSYEAEYVVDPSFVPRPLRPEEIPEHPNVGGFIPPQWSLKERRSKLAQGRQHAQQSRAQLSPFREEGLKKSVFAEILENSEQVVKTPLPDMIREHKRLLQVLRSRSRKDDAKEIKEQAVELKGYEEMQKVSRPANQPTKAPAGEETPKIAKPKETTRSVIVSRPRTASMMTTGSMMKAENAKGMTMHSLPGGYSMHHASSTETWPEGKNMPTPIDTWEVHDPKGEHAGLVKIRHVPHTESKDPVVHDAYLFDEHQNKGLGKAAYQALATHYGSISSDVYQTSTKARRVWKAVGKMTQAIKNKKGQSRFRAEGDPGKPPVMLEKAAPLTKAVPPSGKRLSREAAAAAYTWVTKQNRESRETIPEHTLDEKQRAFGKLSAQTQVKDIGGVPHVLLFRGAKLAGDEPEKYDAESMTWQNHEGLSSWTPVHHIAQRFGLGIDPANRRRPGVSKVFAAWVPMHAIHAYTPMMSSRRWSKESIPSKSFHAQDKYKNYLTNEKEVLLKPGSYQAFEATPNKKKPEPLDPALTPPKTYDALEGRVGTQPIGYSEYGNKGEWTSHVNKDALASRVTGKKRS